MIIPVVFWCYFLPTKFYGWAPPKSSHPFSLALFLLGSHHVSKLKQHSNDYLTRNESVLPELSCPRQLESSNHPREPSPRVL
jgi:hypothetical protein